MATVKKGNGSTTGRRTSAKKPVTAAQQSNGGHAATNGAAFEPTVEEIRVRAYVLFLARGAAHGNDLGDWFAAEKELRAARRT